MTKKTGPRGSQTNKLPLIIFGALALLLAMAVSVGVTWYVVTSTTGGSTVETARLIDKGALYEELKEPFVVNFQRQGRTRYLQASVTLMSRDGQGLASLKEHLPVLRNQLVMLFSSQDFDALLTAPGKEALRQLATVQVQELARQHLGKPVIEHVLFTNFVLQ
jgi:flagellar FliL protein